jgi:hypothetical protein
LALLFLSSLSLGEDRWVRQTATSASPPRAVLVRSEEITHAFFISATLAQGILKGGASFATADREDIGWLRGLVSEEAAAWVRISAINANGSVVSTDGYLRFSSLRNVRRNILDGNTVLELWSEGQDPGKPTPYRVTEKSEIERVTSLTRTP